MSLIKPRRNTAVLKRFLQTKKLPTLFQTKNKNFNNLFHACDIKVGCVNIFIKFLGIGSTFRLVSMNPAPGFSYILRHTSECGRSLTFKKGMNRPDKETLSRIIRRMQKQNDYEKFAELTAASAKVAFRVDFHSVEFSPDDPYHPYLYTYKEYSQHSK